MFARRNNKRKNEINKQQQPLFEDQVAVEDVEVELNSSHTTRIPIMPAGHVEVSSDPEIPAPAGALPTKASGYGSLKVNTNCKKTGTPAGTVPLSSSSSASASQRSKTLITANHVRREKQRSRPTSTRSNVTYASTNMSVASSCRNSPDDSVKEGKREKKNAGKNTTCN